MQANIDKLARASSWDALQKTLDTLTISYMDGLQDSIDVAQVAVDSVRAFTSDLSRFSKVNGVYQINKADVEAEIAKRAA